MVRDILKKIGLQVDADYSQYTWQLWAGEAGSRTRILQENGTNPKISDYSDNLVLGSLEQLRSSPGMVPRYVCRVWVHPSLRPLISEKIWYWLLKEEGGDFEKLRAMYIRDGGGPQGLKWVIILGETRIKRPA